MNEEINSNENSLYELVKEDNSTNMVIQNYNELLSKFENLIKTIIAKINIGKQNSSNNTEDGIFKDLEKNIIELDNTFLALISYFKNPPSDEEKEFINKTASIKKTMEDFAEFANEIQKLSLDDKLKKYNEQINKFCEIVEYKLSYNAENYSSFLDHFVENGKLKLNIFSEIFTKMTKNTKWYLIFFSFTSIGLGIALGILILLTYIKYSEYNNLKERVSTITQGLATISIDENSKGSFTLSFAKNKKTIFNENKNSIQITLQGGE
ncbi:hypothetical protein BED72_07910 [Campylobacter coli]|uniref:Uncharacterized protein n=3 Tax=Campylobacter coli TaxID=195 RepID=A0A5Y5PLR4_CAMCO|nr:hypothetical protein [Campylobacter jejuni]EAH4662684.1 hypothetical protein [Campylobacter coli]EAH5504877.1 hypothetical protein [Campylobacter coli]EAH5885382.1 hypothetical protein [Campylobacter jejuni]EAH5885514.1 hypothetical protein [Campylobacter jejuni]EAH6303996.1 hypothetical protein [Campylobacter coli]